MHLRGLGEGRDISYVREYFEYFSKNPNTLISKFLGIYKVSPSWNKTIKSIHHG